MISKEFQECIKDGDVVIIRSALMDALIIDRTFKKFDEEFEEAVKAKSNLLVPYDEKMIEDDPEKWDMDYLNKQKVALMLNFSQKRIDHLKSVIVKVMPPKVEEEKSTKTNGKEENNIYPAKSDREHSQSTQKTNQKPEHTTRLTGRKVISVTEKKCENKKKDEGNALILGGVFTAAVGVAIVQPVVVGAGVFITGAGVVKKFSN
jgi:hypothetical protein